MFAQFDFGRFIGKAVVLIDDLDTADRFFGIVQWNTDQCFGLESLFVEDGRFKARIFFGIGDHDGLAGLGDQAFDAHSFFDAGIGNVAWTDMKDAVKSVALAVQVPDDTGFGVQCFYDRL